MIYLLEQWKIGLLKQLILLFVLGKEVHRRKNSCKKVYTYSYSTDLSVLSNMILSTIDEEAPSSIHQDLKTSTSVTKQGTNFTRSRVNLT